MDIARGHGEAVRLAHRGRTDDLDGQVEVARHGGDDAQLLVILLAEHGDVGLALDQELGDDRRDPGEEMRACRVFEADRGLPLRHHLDRESVRVHVGDRGGPHQIGVLLTQCLNVRREGSWVGREILAGAELRRVDEDRHHDAGRAPACKTHEGEVAGVQRAHGRHERDGVAVCAPLADGPAQASERAHDERPGCPRWHVGWFR